MLINCTGVTAVDLVGLIAIGDSVGIACTSGVFINGRADVAGNGTSVCIQGRAEAGVLTLINGDGNGDYCIAIGGPVSGRARAGGPLFGTAYSRCIAIGYQANATGTGATGDRNTIAIGNGATATASGTGGAVAIGASASAANGQAVLGSTAFPLEFRVIAAAAGERLRVDATATAGQTALMLYDVDNNTLERVTVGAADSGGAGFKVLRIPN